MVGLPHEHLGEVPALFVVNHVDRDVEAKQNLKHCRERLSSYKVPFVVHFVDEIPRTGSGMIIRFKLRERLVSQEISSTVVGRHRHSCTRAYRAALLSAP